MRNIWIVMAGLLLATGAIAAKPQLVVRTETAPVSGKDCSPHYTMDAGWMVSKQVGANSCSANSGKNWLIKSSSFVGRDDKGKAAFRDLNLLRITSDQTVWLESVCNVSDEASPDFTNGEYDPSIIALRKDVVLPADISSDEPLPGLLRAWYIDKQSGKFSEMNVEAVSCYCAGCVE